MTPAVESAREHLLRVQNLTDPCGCDECERLVAQATRALADEVAVANLLTPLALRY